MSSYFSGMAQSRTPATIHLQVVPVYHRELFVSLILLVLYQLVLRNSQKTSVSGWERKGNLTCIETMDTRAVSSRNLTVFQDLSVSCHVYCLSVSCCVYQALQFGRANITQYLVDSSWWHMAKYSVLLMLHTTSQKFS